MVLSVPVLVLGGPTASGKSQLALELAESFGALIVSADAMTVYRGLDVGTAKPSVDERARVAHRCVDIRDPHEDFNVSDFLAEVDQAVADHSRVIVAGGTPFYLAALLRPLAVLPPPDPRIREELDALADPHGRLTEVDPPLAEKLHPNDRVRIIRALEVFRLTGMPMSAVQGGPTARPPFSGEVVWLDRDDARERIDRRLEHMIQAGYVAEVERALASGVSRDSRPFRSFAYRHIVAHVDGLVDVDEAIRLTARDTWRLARKQRTWARGLDLVPGTPADAWAAAERLWGHP